jgi:hypothetical protein
MALGKTPHPELVEGRTADFQRPPIQRDPRVPSAFAAACAG